MLVIFSTFSSIHRSAGWEGEEHIGGRPSGKQEGSSVLCPGSGVFIRGCAISKLSTMAWRDPSLGCFALLVSFQAFFLRRHTHAHTNTRRLLPYGSEMSIILMRFGLFRHGAHCTLLEMSQCKCSTAVPDKGQGNN